MSIKVKFTLDETYKGRKLKKFIKSVKNKGVFVGYTQHYHYDETGASAALVAATNEYGRPEKGQPPRPFIRSTVRKRSRQWKDLAASVFNRTEDWNKILDEVGVTIADDISETIAKWKEPPNAPSTIKKKGFNDPLVDTGNMMLDFIEIIKE